MPPCSCTAFLPTNLPASAIVARAGGDRVAARLCVLETHLHRGEVRHRADLLDAHQHVGDPVLQRLELADRHAELLARLQILVGGLGQRFDDAQRFRAERRTGKLDRALEHGGAAGSIGQHRGLRNHDTVERDFRGTQAIDRGVVESAQARRIAIDHEQRDAARVRYIAGHPGTDDQVIRLGAVQHHRLASRQLVAIAVHGCRGGDMIEVIPTARLQRAECEDLAAVG